MKIWEEKERSKGLCPRCKQLRDLVFERRSFRLAKTKKTIEGVLLGVCVHCDETVSVPPQSVARIKDVRAAERKSLEARVPGDVKDIVCLVVDMLGAKAPQSALASLVRVYIVRFRDEPRTARMAAKLLSKCRFFRNSPAQDRISIKLSPDLHEIKRDLHSVFRSDSDLIKGIAALSKEEVLDHPNQKRIRSLKESLRQVA